MRGYENNLALPTPASLNSLVWATKRVTAVNNYTIDVYAKFMRMSLQDSEFIFVCTQAAVRSCSF